MNCPRCSGLLVTDWDHCERTQLLKCVLCGNRPHAVTYRPDGSTVGSPLMCTLCRVRPRIPIKYCTGKVVIESQRCAVCPEPENEEQEMRPYHKRKRGKVAA